MEESVYKFQIFLTILSKIEQSPASELTFKFTSKSLFKNGEQIPILEKSDNAARNSIKNLLIDTFDFDSNRIDDELIEEIATHILQDGEITSGTVIRQIEKYQLPTTVKKNIEFKADLLADDWVLAHRTGDDPATIEIIEMMRVGFQNWEKKLHSNQWSAVKSLSPISTDEYISIQQIYTELFLTETENFVKEYSADSVPESEVNAENKRKWNNRIRIDSIFHGTWKRKVIVGDPGGGKTTVSKYLAHRILEGEIYGLDFPIVIQLREFVTDELAPDKHSLLYYFIRTYFGIDSYEEIKVIGKRVLEIISTTKEKGDSGKKILFILDGWDEVEPGTQREKAYRAIEALNEHFPVLIMTRPSGIPRLLEGDKTYYLTGLDYYHIRNLVAKRCMESRSPENLEKSILHHIDRSPNLLYVAENPYLLTLLCQVFIHHQEMVEKITVKADLFNICLGLIKEEYVDKFRVEFSSYEVAVLAQIAFYLVFENTHKRYLFDKKDLKRLSLFAPFKKNIERSRLINFSNSHYAFIHNQFLEYFSAKYLSDELTNEHFYDICSKNLFKQSFLEEFRFLASLVSKDNNKNQIFWTAIREILVTPDIFGTILLETVYLVAAQGVKDGGEELLGFDLREKLWHIIKASNESYFDHTYVGRVNTERYAEALSLLDSRFLAEKFLMTLQSEYEDAINMIVAEEIYRSIPTQVRRDISLDKELKATDLDFLLGIDTRGTLSDQDILDFAHTLYLPNDVLINEKIEAIRQLGAIRYIPIIPRLLEMLDFESEIFDCVAETLGKFGGEEVSVRLVDKLLEPVEHLKPKKRELVIIKKLSLLNALKKEGYGALEIKGQHKLIHYLDSHNYNDPNIDFVLQALEGSTLPETRHAQVIYDLLVEESASEITKIYALRVLSGDIPSKIKERMWEVIKYTSDQSFQYQALKKFVNHRLPQDADWLLEFYKNSEIEWEHRKYVLTWLIRGCEKDKNQVILLQKLKKTLSEDFIRISQGDIDVEKDMDLMEVVSIIPEYRSQLLQGLLSGDFDLTSRQKAYQCLAEVGFMDIMPKLEEELKPYEIGLLDIDDLFVRAIFENIKKLNPSLLLLHLSDMKNLERYVHEKLYELSKERGWRVFTDCIEDSERNIIYRIHVPGDTNPEPHLGPSKNEQDRLFWEAIAKGIEEKYKQGHPTIWNNLQINLFRNHMENVLEELCAKDVDKSKFCGKPISIINATNFKKLFKNESSGKTTTKHQFAIYIGYECYLDFINKKKLF